MSPDTVTVLVVDDDRGWRELYAAWLAEYDAKDGALDVRTARNGDDALDTLDTSVDIVFLDREMSGPSGSDIAERITAGDHDPHVALSSSKPPDVDIAELPIDTYIQKPADEADIRTVVDEYRAKRRYHAALDEYFALTAKLAAIEAHRPREELDGNERYVELKARVVRKRREVDELLRAETPDWTTAFESLGTGAEPPDERGRRQGQEV